MLRLWTIAAVVALAACSGETSDVSVTEPAPTTTSSDSVPATSSTSTTVPAEEDVPTLALYLATIEQGLEGTPLEGAAFQEPMSLVDTGVLFCDLLDAGLSPVDVLRGWVAALSAEGAVPDEHDVRLGGVVLGAAVRFICPEHLDLLEL
ncbi:MAG TPA: DUF732 domain-containing protein [Acidimicrobiia bacterium]|nr:DUF732 domain-containing protein [Acidimicrobiia bacterium]